MAVHHLELRQLLRRGAGGAAVLRRAGQLGRGRLYRRPRADAVRAAGSTTATLGSAATQRVVAMRLSPDMDLLTVRLSMPIR